MFLFYFHYRGGIRWVSKPLLQRQVGLQTPSRQETLYQKPLKETFVVCARNLKVNIDTQGKSFIEYITVPILPIFGHTRNNIWRSLYSECNRFSWFKVSVRVQVEKIWKSV